MAAKRRSTRKSMTPAQRRFSRAAKKCGTGKHGAYPACMSKSLSGLGKAPAKRRTRKGKR